MMLIRLTLLAMLFAASAMAEPQEKNMLDRMLNPDLHRTNPFEGKSFEGKTFGSREFRGAGGYGEVKAARTKTFTTRNFLGIRNPWFGKKVYETPEAKDQRRFAMSDRAYRSKAAESRSYRDAEKGAPASGKTEDDATRPFLGRGKSQESLERSNPTPGGLSLDEVKEILNRNR